VTSARDPQLHLSEGRKSVLLEAGLALASELSLPAVLQRIVELATKVTGARYGALGVLDPDGREIAQFETTGLTPEERRAIGALPRGHGILGALITDAQPLRLRRIGDDPRSVGFPVNHPPMKSFLGAPVRALGRVYGNIYLTDKQGADEFDEQDEAALLMLAAQAGVAVANAQLYEQTQRRGAWLEALSVITGHILAGADPEDLLQRVAHSARLLAGAATSAVITPAERGELVIAAADGARADRLQGLGVPLDHSMAGAVMRTGKTLVVEDASHEAAAYGPVVVLAEMGRVVCVPLKAKGQPVGALWVTNPVARPPFGKEAVRLVESFADQTSVALEYARAQRELGRLVLFEERERIARELHDGIIQAVFAVGMGLQGTAMMVADADAALRIEEAVGELDRVIRDLRNYIFGLRPGILADRQLGQALRNLATEFEAKSGIPAAADIDPDAAALLSSQAAPVVQMAREALSNVARHARAMRCRLSLVREPRAVVLAVEDDGAGFDPEQPRPDGQGLRHLRERAEALGGSLRLTSAPGAGTTLRIELPV